MDSIRFENVSKSFGKTKVINNLNLSIEKGESADSFRAFWLWEIYDSSDDQWA